MVKFEGLDTPKGLGDLNKHLQDNSYIGGYTPSQSDVQVFSTVTSAPDANKAPHVARWWNHIASFSEEEKKSWAAAVETKAEEKKETKADDDFDLFGEDKEADANWESEIQRRADEHAAKKAASGKKVEALKSVVIIDVKPWDDTTDLEKLEESVRTVTIEGLEWKASKLVAIGYGIKKLQISAHVVDELVSIDDVQEQIQAFEDLVQSTDIVQFTKL